MVKPRHPIPTLEEFRSHLRRHGLRATRQRLAVHEAMMELVHASAEDVQILLFQRGTPVNTTTVYNILSQLADEHIYNRRLSGNNIMYFDVDPRRHLHLYDRENHLFRNVEDEQLSALVAAQLKRHKFRGYTIEDLDIQIIVKPTRKKKKP